MCTSSIQGVNMRRGRTDKNGAPSLFDMPKYRLDYLTITFTALSASFTM